MSILFSSEHGWVISHNEYINRVYKNVANNATARNYQHLKHLFDIKTPFLRYNQNVAKYDNSNLKQKLNKVDVTNENFETMQNMIQHVTKLYYEFMEEIVSEQIFQTQIESINSTHNNKDAITAAKICESHSDKFKGFGENSDKTCLQTINNEIYLFPNNCRFYAKNVSEINQFIFEKFDLILLDPPWWNKSVRRKRTKPGHGYDMMYNTDLSIIPINELLNVGGLVVIWSTNSPQNMKDLKSEVLPAWGLDIVAVWYWIKVTKYGEPICKFSRPFIKQPFEQIILTKRKCDPTVDIPDNKMVMSVPSAINSHKPPLDDILKPYIAENAKCLEIFARYLLPNWTSWGLETIKLQHISLYEEVH